MNREIVFKIKKCKLQLLLALLALIFFLSAPKKEKEFKSALLNPKYKVDEIELIQRNSQKLLLKKTGSFWLGETEIEGKDKLYFSCQNELVQKLLFNLSGITSFYEMSSGRKNLQKYGLAKEDSFTLRLSQNDSVVSAITFGSLDSRHRIFFCVQNQEKIFAAPSSPFEPYLTVNVDFWASPEIFPKEIVGADLKYRREESPLQKAWIGQRLWKRFTTQKTETFTRPSLFQEMILQTIIIALFLPSRPPKEAKKKKTP